VDFVLEEHDADYKPALSLRDRLDDPDYYNETITPSYLAKVEDVERMLREAQDFYQTGQFSYALKRVDQVLAVDKFNSAARRLQEKINNYIVKTYGTDSYNAMRSRALKEITLGWAPTVQDYGESITVDTGDGEAGPNRAAMIQQMLQNIIIPNLNFQDATVAEAIEFLRAESMRLDPQNRGINFVLRLNVPGGAAAMPSATEEGEFGIGEFGSEGGAATGGTNLANQRIQLRLSNVPLATALQYITAQAGLKYRVEDYAVIIVPEGTVEDTGVLITREFRVPPDFLGRGGPGGGGGDDFGGGDTGGGAFGFPTGDGGADTGTGRKNAVDVLRSFGVEFPSGASAVFIPSNSRLVVRNTQSNIELIEQIVEGMTTDVPKQISIESKFLEITQQNLSELGFDVLLGQANIPGNEGVFVGGGTEGVTSPPLNSIPFPFTPPGSNVPVGANPVTLGNRSGNTAITTDSIDSLIFPSPARQGLSVAPGVFAVAGVFSDPQFQIVMRAIEQKKAVDLLSAPKVTTKSGQRAVIQINREFRYPVEFDPPQIPQDFGGGDGDSTITSNVFPVTPTTPTAFETKNTGVTLEVEPTVGSDGVTIDLNLIPEVIEFEGFINYGSPIQTFGTDVFGQVDPVVITDNVINQPVFSVRRVSTTISIWDGATVVLGGLIREDIQKVEDKVPFFGDIPIVGRLFRSEAEQHVKRNLIIFVTATLIDPAGVPIRAKDDLTEPETEILGIPNPVIRQVPEIPLYK
jgi:general secretion pathway protein D